MKRRTPIKSRVIVVDGYKVTVELYRHTITARLCFRYSTTKMKTDINFDKHAPIWKMKKMFIFYSNHIEALEILKFAKNIDIPEA